MTVLLSCTIPGQSIPADHPGLECGFLSSANIFKLSNGCSAILGLEQFLSGICSCECISWMVLISISWRMGNLSFSSLVISLGFLSRVFLIVSIFWLVTLFLRPEPVFLSGIGVSGLAGDEVGSNLARLNSRSQDGNDKPVQLAICFKETLLAFSLKAKAPTSQLACVGISKVCVGISEVHNELRR